MSDIKQKLSEATTAYEAARDNLEKNRSAYEAGPGKKYASVKQNIDALKAKIEEHRRAHQVAKDELAQALHDSNGNLTEKAREALAARRNAEDMIEECSGLLHQVEKTALAIRLEASEAATAYRNAYQLASQLWARMNVYAMLDECGERLCAAIVVSPDVGTSKDYDEHSLYGKWTEMPRNVLLAEIENMIRDYQGDARPYIRELGVCNLGAMTAQEIMSPAERTMARTKAGSA